MIREMKVEWSTDETEEGSTEVLLTRISIENDDNGNSWISFSVDRGKEFKRFISSVDIVKLSRFFYDAADFIKSDG